MTNGNNDEVGYPLAGEPERDEEWAELLDELGFGDLLIETGSIEDVEGEFIN